MHSFILWGVFSQILVAQPLTMGFLNTDAKPFKWKVEGEFVGPFLDIMRELELRSGVSMQFEPLPMKRLLLYLENGKIDGAFGLHKTPEREKILIFFNTPIKWITAHLFVKKGHSFQIKSLSDLSGKRVNLIRGTWYGEDFGRLIKQGKIEIKHAQDYDQLLQMLISERVDFSVATTSVIQAYLSKKNNIYKENIVMLPLVLYKPRPLYIVFSKASKLPHKYQVINKINHALKEMETKNIFDKITHPYGYTRFHQ